MIRPSTNNSDFLSILRIMTSISINNKQPWNNIEKINCSSSVPQESLLSDWDVNITPPYNISCIIITYNSFFFGCSPGLFSGSHTKCTSGGDGGLMDCWITYWVSVLWLQCEFVKTGNTCILNYVPFRFINPKAAQMLMQFISNNWHLSSDSLLLWTTIFEFMDIIMG